MTKNILIAEDDDDLRELLATLLSVEGFDVQTARHGREALDRIGEHMPDLILLDMKMPVMDGWAFALEFQIRHGCSVPIMVLTAAEHAALRAQEIGAAEWIAKPFHYDQLVRMIRSHLRT